MICIVVRVGSIFMRVALIVALLGAQPLCMLAMSRAVAGDRQTAMARNAHACCRQAAKEPSAKEPSSPVTPAKNDACEKRCADGKATPPASNHLAAAIAWMIGHAMVMTEPAGDREVQKAIAEANDLCLVHPMQDAIHHSCLLNL